MVARLDPGDAGADVLDDSRALVAEHHRQAGLQVAVCDVHVGVAQPGVGVADQNLAVPWPVEIELDDFDRLAHLVHDCCFGLHRRGSLPPDGEPPPARCWRLGLGLQARRGVAKVSAHRTSVRHVHSGGHVRPTGQGKAGTWGHPDPWRADGRRPPRRRYPGPRNLSACTGPRRSKASGRHPLTRYTVSPTIESLNLTATEELAATEEPEQHVDDVGRGVGRDLCTRRADLPPVVRGLLIGPVSIRGRRSRRCRILRGASGVHAARPRSARDA